MRRFLGLLLVMFGLVPATDYASVEAYPLSLAQREHLKTYAPRTFLKLDNQRSIHIVALGDSVTWMYTRDDNNGNWLLSYLGAFSSNLARQFFYPGGVRALNPEKGMPAKLKDHQGREIFIENLAIPGRCALDALQRVSTDAFINSPDLVVIDFGINDAVRGHSLDSYRRALQRTVDACKAAGTDVIILAPSIIRAGTGPTGWGMTRPYATVAKEVAAQNSVLFVDLGKSLAPLGGGVPAGVEPEAAVLTMADRLGRIFEFDPAPPTPETLHPNEEAHEVMGRALYEALLVPEPEPEPYRLDARGFVESNEEIKVKVTLKNLSDEPKKGYLGALSVGRTFTPTDPYQAFELQPGRSAEYEIPYKRHKAPMIPGDHAALDVSDPSLRLSYFIVDEERSRLMDVVTRLAPVSIEWTQQRFDNVKNDLRYEWRFVNGSTDNIAGRYRIGMGEKAVSKWVPFELPGLGAKKFEATFPFSAPKGAARVKTGMFVEIDVDGKQFTFPRELEAIRDVGLSERVALSRYSDYGVTTGVDRVGMAEPNSSGGSVVMRADADENFLYFSFDFADVGFQPVPNSPSLVADIAIDGRPVAEVGSFGFVDKVRINVPATDGPIQVDRPQFAAFGDGRGNNVAIPSGGITAELKTRTGGERRLEVRIPVAYLIRFDGTVGDPRAVLGVNANFSFVSVGEGGQPAFDVENRYVHTAPTAGPDQTLYIRDPRGFGRLRLATGEADTWTAHLY